MATSSDSRRERGMTPQRPQMPRLAASTNSVRATPSPRLAMNTPSSEKPAARSPLPGLGPGKQIYLNTPPSRASTDSLASSATPLRPRLAGSARSVVAQDKALDISRPGTAPDPRRPPLASQFSSSSNVASEAGTRGHIPPLPTDGPRLKSAATQALKQEQDPGSMFFHSNDIRAVVQSKPMVPRPLSSTFVYANGGWEDAESGPIISSPNGTTQGLSLNSVKTPTANRPAPGSKALSPPRAPRPVSPTKGSMHLTYRKGASQIIQPGVASPFASPVEGSQYPFPNLPRKSARGREPSIDESERGEVAATSTANTGMTSLLVESPLETLVNEIPHPRSPKAVSSAGTADNICTQVALSPARMQSPDRPRELLRSPQLGSMDASSVAGDAAANARRERKVLDLEISNNSLMAINRSLEREVKKQKAELRRMRRFTRNISSGAWPVPEPGERSHASGEFSDTGTDEDVKDPIDLTLESEDMSEDDSFAEDRSSSMSPDGVDTRADAAESKRLHLDLARHRDMILDGQRMNQCIKRCLGITDCLILEGTRALAYRVPLDEIKLGGRVLDMDELTDFSHDQHLPEIPNMDAQVDEDLSHVLERGLLPVPMKARLGPSLRSNTSDESVNVVVP